ncbi:hypothetical protein M513_01665 [Trichuris suis]|uniref:Uncharacterized protein n=1 Tax=Trichuris suis TaxID=68888 RepID=A0A085MK16_9BILA|nr:hypothetical protein M513_01665 [Trichuris suis]
MMSFTNYLFRIVVLRTALCCLPTKLPGTTPTTTVALPMEGSSVPFVSTVVEDDVLNITLNYGGPVFKPFTVLLLRELLNGSRVVATTTVCDDRPSFMIMGLQASRWYGLSVLTTFQRPKGRLRSMADYRAFDTPQSVNRSGRQKSKAVSLQVQVTLFNDLIEYKLYSRLAEHFPTLLELRPSCPLPGLPKRVYLDTDQNTVTINVTGLEDPDGLEVIGALLSQDENLNMTCQQLCWSASIESNSVVYKYDEDCQLLRPTVVSDGASGNGIYTNVEQQAVSTSGSDVESSGIETTESLPGELTQPSESQHTETSEVEPTVPSVAESTIPSGGEPSISGQTESSGTEPMEVPEPETIQPSVAESSTPSGGEQMESSETVPLLSSTSEHMEFTETEPTELPGIATIEPSESESTVSSGAELTPLASEQTESSGSETLEPPETGSTVPSGDTPTESSAIEVTVASTGEPTESSAVAPSQFAGVETTASSGNEPTESSGEPIGELTQSTEVELSDSTYPDYAELTEKQTVELESAETVQSEPATTSQPDDGASVVALSTLLMLAICLFWQGALVDNVQSLMNGEIYLEERKFSQRLMR